MTNGLFSTSLRFVLVELIGDFLYWPLWWYTKGLKNATNFTLRKIIDQEEALGVSIWAKNIFVPMYGQYDIEGRLISFFIRLIQVIVRTILLIVWVVLLIIPLLIWIFLPLIVIYQIYLNITQGF